MRIAITRAVSPALAKCELSYVMRQSIDLARAQEQHHAYEELLEQLGARVISLPPEPALPDSMFVEDPALVLDEVAVIFPLGVESRRAEAASLSLALSAFRRLARVVLPGTIEGGDILRIERRLYVGATRRTNAEGIRQLKEILQPLGYRITPVAVTGCLHLKSAVTQIDGDLLLANRAWFDAAAFRGCEFLDVAAEEPHGGNALLLNGTIVFPSSFPRTRARIEARGLKVTSIDISELQKAEAGLTCSSLLFTA